MATTGKPSSLIAGESWPASARRKIHIPRVDRNLAYSLRLPPRNFEPKEREFALEIDLMRRSSLSETSGLRRFAANFSIRLLQRIFAGHPVIECSDHGVDKQKPQGHR